MTLSLCFDSILTGRPIYTTPTVPLVAAADGLESADIGRCILRSQIPLR